MSRCARRRKTRRSRSPEPEPEPEPEIEDSDPFDFDLGLSAPRMGSAAGASSSTPTPAPSEPATARDPSPAPPERPSFERQVTPPGGPEPEVLEQLSASSSNTGVKGTMFGMPVNFSDGSDTPAPEPAPKEVAPELDRVSEDEFFALAESIAAEQSSVVEQQRPYRGEPRVLRGSSEEDSPRYRPEPFSRGSGTGEKDNPFAHEAPTGVRKEALGSAASASQSSFVLEEIDSESESIEPVALARQHYESGQIEQAQQLLEEHLEQEPEDAGARELLGSIQDELERQHLNRLGSLTHTPVINVALRDLANLDLDHRSGFLISQIDGMMTFEDILDLSAMSRLETMEVLADLLEREVIAVN